MNAADKLAYTRAEAATACGDEVSTIIRAIKAGDLAETFPKIAGEKVKRGRIMRDELERWISGCAA